MVADLVEIAKECWVLWSHREGTLGQTSDSLQDVVEDETTQGTNTDGSDLL